MQTGSRSSVVRRSVSLTSARKASSTKSWATSGHDAALPPTVQRAGGATEGGIDPVEAMKVIKCTTRFATVMCVCIATLKVFVYMMVKSPVVKTSALDSLGDLVANCITMYTSYRMNLKQPSMFPVGQSSFEPIGVTVFSTLMASAMFANLLNNIEDIMENEANDREKDVWGFWNDLFVPMYSLMHGKIDITVVEENDRLVQDVVGAKDEDAAREELEETVENIGDTDDAEWDFWHSFGREMWLAAKSNKLVDKAAGATDESNALYGVMKCDVAEVKSGSLGKDITAKEHETNHANKEDELDCVQGAMRPYTMGSTTYFAVKFLACCATYKFFLWLFCVTIAIPRTHSAILVALANDKRNDFVATSFVCVCLILNYEKGEGFSDWLQDKLDPLCSAVLTCFIIYTWLVLLREQVVVISRYRAEYDVIDPIREDVERIMQRHQPIKADKVVAYSSGIKYIVEVNLTVPTDTAFEQAEMCMKDLDGIMNQGEFFSFREDVERVIICCRSAHKSL